MRIKQAPYKADIMKPAVGKRPRVEAKSVEHVTDSEDNTSEDNTSEEVDDEELVFCLPGLNEGDPNTMTFSLPGGLEFHLPTDDKGSWKYMTGLTLINKVNKVNKVNKAGEAEEEEQPAAAFVLSNATDRLILCKIKPNNFWYLRYDSSATTCCVIQTLDDDLCARVAAVLSRTLFDEDEFDRMPIAQDSRDSQDSQDELIPGWNQIVRATSVHTVTVKKET